MKIISNPSTHIPLCISYECKSINALKSNYTIRYIPNSYLNTKKKKIEQKIQENIKEK